MRISVATHHETSWFSCTTFSYIQRMSNNILSRMRILLILTFCTSANCSLAADFPKQASIFLLDASQLETKIGDVSFTSTGSGTTSVQLNIDTGGPFTEHFLSMRPFRCIEGATEWFCYLEYPYDLRSVITKDDLSDLEYQLLFIRKRPSEFGIDAWNGLYYKLELESDGTITGKLLEGDLNALQSPPAEKYAKPVDLNEFIPGDKTKRLYPTLKIY